MKLQQIALMDTDEKHRFYIRFAFMTYIFLISILMLLQKNYPDMLDESLYISFLASSWEDIIFFGLVGLAITFFSLRHPKADALQHRIQNLYSFNKVTPAMQNSVIEDIEKHSLYSKENTIDIRITEFNHELDAFKIFVRQTMKLESMIHDLAVSYKRPLEFEFDDFDVEVPNGIQGKIVRATFKLDNIEKAKILYEDEVLMDDSLVEREINEIIPVGQSAVIDLEYWLWSRNEEDFELQAHHNAEAMYITIYNRSVNTDPDISINFNGENHLLNKKQDVKIANGGFFKIDSSVVFRISKNKKE